MAKPNTLSVGFLKLSSDLDAATGGDGLDLFNGADGSRTSPADSPPRQVTAQNVRTGSRSGPGGRLYRGPANASASAGAAPSDFTSHCRLQPERRQVISPATVGCNLT